jgi:predicted homoserine dehydrogenase-like protein
MTTSILLNELEKRERDNDPVRVVIAGTGWGARNIARRIKSTRGMRVSCLVRRATTKSDIEADFTIHSPEELRSWNGAVLMDLTGNPANGARLALAAIKNRMHFCSNSELNATAGPQIARMADDAGLVYSGIDGDQPAVEMDLYNKAMSMGLNPRVLGSMKGVLLPYHTREKAEEFAKRNGISTTMAVSFADGTKVALEQAEVANAVAARTIGPRMNGTSVLPGTPIEQMGFAYEDRLDSSGLRVDFAIGAEPGPGVYCFFDEPDAKTRTTLNYLKVGRFLYEPVHMFPLVAHLTAARAVLFNNAAIRPAGRFVSVEAVAKKPIQKGTVLPGIGNDLYRGVATNRVCLHLGVLEGAEVVNDIPEGAPITCCDVCVADHAPLVQLFTGNLAG